MINFIAYVIDSNMINSYMPKSKLMNVFSHLSQDKKVKKNIDNI